MTNIQNRDNFLKDIAEKLGRERRTEGVVRPKWKYQPQWDVLAGYTVDELVNVLEKQCQSIHTDFFKTHSTELNSTLLEVLKKYECHQAITWDDPRFTSFGMKDFFQTIRNDEDISVYEWDAENAEESIKIAEQADVGITFSDITLAESGTVVLFSSKDKGRSVSLLPRTYIAIIPKSTIVPRMTHATKEIHERLKDGESISSCVNFITGPSNSADIEMSLVVGVHGPYKAAYIVVEDQ